MECDAKENESINDEQQHKKGRHRKKQLYTSILLQMEFYFSDSNLRKDRFLSQLLQENKYVDINVFLKFNKIRKLTSNVDDIKKAIKNSKLIELSEDRNSVCRKEPIKEKPNVDECTIYVERLKADATHEWLSSVFSEFGNVVYVSLPRYKHSNLIKGFGFIEFEKQSEAEKAVNYFENIGCKMPSNTEPEQLCSISTFEKEEDEQNNEKSSEKIINKIINKQVGKSNEKNTCQSEESKEKCEIQEHNKITNKRKIEIEDDEFPETKKQKIDDSEEAYEGNKQKINSGEISESEDTESKKKKKLKKEHKKKNYIKEHGLQVLSKQEWKRMRNRYLDLQRKKMKEFKKHLLKAKFNQANYDDKSKKSNEKVEKKKETSEPAQKVNFIESVIVKLKLPEPITDQRKLKDELKSLSSDIQYVDLKNMITDEVYLRFSNSESATKFCSHEYGGKKEVLAGEEEKLYWEKIQKDRENKFKKTNKKQRGRDKLLKKAKHIKFDD